VEQAGGAALIDGDAGLGLELMLTKVDGVELDGASNAVIGGGAMLEGYAAVMEKVGHELEQPGMPLVDVIRAGRLAEIAIGLEGGEDGGDVALGEGILVGEDHIAEADGGIEGEQRRANAVPTEEGPETVVEADGLQAVAANGVLTDNCERQGELFGGQMQVEQAFEDGALVVACSPNGLEGGAALEKPALALHDVFFGLVEGADG
jgi:hypothetical protein